MSNLEDSNPNNTCEESMSNSNNTDSPSPCNNPDNLICRQYVNQGNCRKRKRCSFYHPEVITPIVVKQARRELGHCYCGSFQRRIINQRAFRNPDPDNSIPRFFAVCSRTGRSMRHCMS